MKKTILIFLAFLMIWHTAVFAQDFNIIKNDFLDTLSEETELSFDEIFLLQLNGYQIKADMLEAYRKQARTGSFPTAIYLANLINVLDYEGFDVTDFEGLNLVEKLYNYKFVHREGSRAIATVVRVLNRFDNIPVDALNNPLLQVFELLSYQNEDGGFCTFKPEISHVDTTATIITALAPYTYIDEVNRAVVKALNYLAASRNENGGYTIFTEETSISIALVITSLLEMKTDPAIPEFKKDGITLADSLLEFQLADNTFKKTIDGKYDREATVIAYTAMTAMERIFSGKSPIYNLKDFKYKTTPEQFADYNEISEDKKSYIEIAKHLGITQGDTNGNFNPHSNITRAEFVTALLRTMNYQLTSDYEPVFEDVQNASWYWKYVLTAKKNGFINGISPTLFAPESNITKQDVAVIITNIYSMPYDKTISFSDLEYTSDYAKAAVMMCVQNGIFELENDCFNSHTEADRETVMTALVKLLKYLATE